jgi:hypothetical protein
VDVRSIVKLTLLVVRLVNHLEGDLKQGPCVPVFGGLATFLPDGATCRGRRHAWDD